MRRMATGIKYLVVESQAHSRTWVWWQRSARVKSAGKSSPGTRTRACGDSGQGPILAMNHSERWAASPTGRSELGACKVRDMVFGYNVYIVKSEL